MSQSVLFEARIESARQRAVGSKLIGYLVGANEPGISVAEHELDELPKQADPVTSTGRLWMHRQDHASFTNVVIQVREFALPDVENVLGSSQASQIRHTGHEFEEWNIVEMPRNR
jgi:hypothetical protein